MKRTTIYLDADLEMRLKMEGVRRKRPMAQLIREAVETYLAGGAAAGPPGGGAFTSGRRDTADRAEDILAKTGFGGVARPVRPARAKRRA
jgi:hypothetical protein